MKKYNELTIEEKIKYGYPEEIDQLIPFIMWSEKNVKQWLFSELHVYSESLWCGGIIDAAYIDMQDNFVLVDFKSGGAWLNGFIQLGGYAKQLMENKGGFDKDGNKIYSYVHQKVEMLSFELVFTAPHSLTIFPFKNGFKEPTIITGQTHKYMDAFEYALKLYKLQKEFENGK